MTSGKERRSVLLLATLLGLLFAVLALHGLTSHERGHSHHAAAAVLFPGDATEAELAWALRRAAPRRVLYLAHRWTHQGRVPLGRTADAPCLHGLSVLRC